MSPKVSLHHTTHYIYDKAVALGPQVIQLRPTPHCRTPILRYSLEITPPEHTLYWQFDPHANHLARVIFPNKTTEFKVEVNLVADLTPINPFGFLLEPGYETYPFRYSPELAKDLEPYRSADPAGPLLRRFMNEVAKDSQGTVGFLIGVNARIRDTIGYVTRLEQGVQSCEETLRVRTGSCRDSAWLLVQVLRQLGMAARFVSGYLIQLAEEGVADGPKVDSADLHAWAEVFLPGAGWIGLDATSGLFAAEGHIPLVCTQSAAQAAPIGGTVELSGVTFSHAMTVRRLDAGVRLSKPYSDTEWERVRQVAHTIDRELDAQDVRLTMGGEPTYVGIDEPESMQWNLEALGDLKCTRGLTLIRRLREQTAPGGLLHYRARKVVPGRAVTAMGNALRLAQWTAMAMWEDARSDRASKECERGFGVEDSRCDLLTALAQRLAGEFNEIILAAFEPGSENDDRSKSLTGYVLPLRRRQRAGGKFWCGRASSGSSVRKSLVLFPGDSPIGYRIYGGAGYRLSHPMS